MSLNDVVRKNVFRFLGLVDREAEDQLRDITRRRQSLPELTDEQLRSAAKALESGAAITEVFALTAEVAERTLRIAHVRCADCGRARTRARQHR